MFVCIFSLMFLVSCASESESYIKQDTGEVLKDIEMKKISVASATTPERVATDFKESKNRNSNLIMRNIRPYCNQVDTVSDIGCYGLGNYKGITDPVEMYSEFMNLIHSYIGDDLDEEYFKCDYYMDIPPSDKYASFGEFKEALLNGEALEPSDLGYYMKTDEEYLFAELQKNLINVFFNKGEIYTAIPIEIKENSERAGATYARFLCEKVADYYVNNLDNNLEDEFPLKNGTMSICEGIAFIENYLNNDLGIDGNDDVELKVTKVEVYKVYEGCYCYRYMVTREILGLTKICINNGTIINSRFQYELSDAYMIYTDEIDSYFGRTRLLNYEKANELDEMLPLSVALDIISEGIGENSSYYVNNISLGYLDLYTPEREAQTSLEASWIVECENVLDSSSTTFYVNVNTGNVTVTKY